MKLKRYDEIWAVDFEFHSPPGDCPEPICMVAKNLLTGRVVRLVGEDLVRQAEVPFDVGPNALFVAYYAPAELGCFLSLGWTLPINIVDLYVEFRNSTNGYKPPFGSGLLGALAFHGFGMGKGTEKKEMQDLAIRGGPYTVGELAALLDYCQDDVEDLELLWGAMQERLDQSALLRGSYMAAVARMERQGIPIDKATLDRFNECWSDLQLHLQDSIDPNHEIWIEGRFSQKGFLRWTEAHGIPWPKLSSGFLDLSDDTFSEMARLFPGLRDVHQVRQMLALLRRSSLQIGRDGRNRTMLSAFGSRSGRNQPSTSRFIFGAPSWMRGLIQPAPGRALAYVDWSQQEFGIAAVLSEDPAMQEAYRTSDPYLAFAKMAGAVPQDATKQSHGKVREIYKIVVLGVGYCMGAHGLARRLATPWWAAEELLRLHRRCYPKFWDWSQAASDYGQLIGQLHSRFGWKLHAARDTKFASLRNFPCQANGAEMMRLASIYATEAGVEVCAPVHDAFLIEAPVDRIEAQVEFLRSCMNRASADVLNGFVLGTDVDIIRSPDRFGYQKPNPMWDRAIEFVK